MWCHHGVCARGNPSLGTCDLGDTHDTILSLARRVDGVATPTAPHAIRSRVIRRAAHSVLESLDNTCVHLAGMLLLLALSLGAVLAPRSCTSAVI